MCMHNKSKSPKREGGGGSVTALAMMDYPFQLINFKKKYSILLMKLNIYFPMVRYERDLLSSI